MKTPAYAIGRTVAPASQATTPPTAVNATNAKKIGLGRTDACPCESTGRSYRTSSQPST
ncbi:hypothetical protein ATCCBAA256_05770 [Mycobacterium montefiorense]|nr:hypothetical protein ATCCBAA256_05770 [Mycobacterium montefiorense]